MGQRAASQSSNRSRAPRVRRRPDSNVDGLVRRNAEAIKRGFGEYRAAFSRITRRAKVRFEQRNWVGAQADARARLELYGRAVKRVAAEVRANLSVRDHDPAVWAQVRRSYAEKTAGAGAIGVAETFFNSVTRRLFSTVGVNPTIEFVDFAFQRIPTGLGDTPFLTYASIDGTDNLFRELLAEFEFRVSYRDVDVDAVQIAKVVDDAWERGAAPVPFEAVEVLKAVFYRRKAAYLVGRVRGGNRVMPLVIALGNKADGVFTDAVLVHEDDVSVLFSFTRSYFQADVDRPADVIQFLRSLMPLKPTTELYNALGFNRHGKTELFRDLQRHLSHSAEKFQITPGTPGMVMLVFAMPGFDVVFKVIRDQFPHPKQTTEADVRRRYKLVFGHDRAGRLVDAQEFEHLVFSKHNFSEDLLGALLGSASKNVTVDGDAVTIKHLYTERKVKPLDVFLLENDGPSRQRVLGDYAQAIQDLAATGVFPGDFLFKNFGVTRQGRVIFYDYDELCLLSECFFRQLPTAEVPEDEMSEEPWFGVGQSDVFPEEFSRFLSLNRGERDHFVEAHSHLFDALYWRRIQERHASGEIVDIYPYPPDRRFSNL